MDFWEDRYRQSNTPWDREEPSPALMAWLSDDTLQPCRILVPGCGRGHEVVELARRGFEVTGLDIAPSAVAHLRERAGEVATVLQADVLTWTADAPFDAVYEQTCLCALPPSDWPRYEAQLQAWLRPGGRLYAAFMQTGRPGGPPYDCPLPLMRSLFTAWDWPPSHPRDVPHPVGFHELTTILARR